MQRNKHKVGVAILILNKMDYKTVSPDIKRAFHNDKKRSTHHNNHKCIFLYRSSKHMKQKLIELKGEIDKPTITVEDLNTALSALNKTRKKFSKNTEDMKNAINLHDLIGI